MLKIGIPRSLTYYNYHPLWKTFFEELGAEVVVSPPTTRTILKQGVKAAESEFCLPVKVYYGHALCLTGLVDTLFIPRIVSVEKRAYTCPKLLGLPDMIRAVDDAPSVWSPTIDFTKGKKAFYSSVFETGKMLSRDSFSILRAYLKAASEYRKFQVRLREGVPRHQAIECGDGKASGKEKRPLKIGLVGHDYIISDSYVTMNLAERLEKLGVCLVTPDTLPRRIINREAATLPKSLFWSYEKDIIGAAFHWMKKGLADGIIYVLAFACGPDSLIQTLLEYEARRTGGRMPLMSIVIDEHSGEAGLVTRIEAFVDMLMRAKKESLVEA